MKHMTYLARNYIRKAVYSKSEKVRLELLAHSHDFRLLATFSA